MERTVIDDSFTVGAKIYRVRYPPSLSRQQAFLTIFYSELSRTDRLEAFASTFSSTREEGARLEKHLGPKSHASIGSDERCTIVAEENCETADEKEKTKAALRVRAGEIKQARVSAQREYRDEIEARLRAASPLLLYAQLSHALGSLVCCRAATGTKAGYHLLRAGFNTVVGETKISGVSAPALPSEDVGTSNSEAACPDNVCSQRQV
jgi:hypothetical protein